MSTGAVTPFGARRSNRTDWGAAARRRPNSRSFELAGILLVCMCIGRICTSQEPEAASLIPDWWSRQAVSTIPRAYPAPPVVDGQIRYREWYHASAAGGFVDATGGALSDLDVRMQVCWDDSTVYIAVTVYRPPMHPTPRATFAPGRHDHIWWRDDNIELVLRPGRRDHGVSHFYALAVNSVGAWSLMRGDLEGSGGDTSVPADWQVAASRQGREHWAVEIAIPIASLERCERPAEGAVWFMDVMNQQVTPAKRMIDLGLVWNLGMHGYRSPVTPRFEFVESGPIQRPHGIGRLPVTAAQRDAGEASLGSRMVFYNVGANPISLRAQVQLFRAPVSRPEGSLDLFRAWDIIRQIRATGKPWLDPAQEIQAFRSEADILRELNERYALVAERSTDMSVPPRGDAAGAAYLPLEVPLETGRYIVAWRYADADTGRVLSAQVVPFDVMPDLALSLRPYFLLHRKVRAEASLENITTAGGASVEFTLEAGGTRLDRAVAPVEGEAESVSVYLDTSELAPGTQGTVTARLLDADGAERMRNAAPLARPADPSWFGNAIGRSPVVPPPFEPLNADGDRGVRLWQRRVEVGAACLPASIVARGTEILARPMAFDLAGASLDMQPVRQECTERDATFVADGHIADIPAHMTATMHYDGTIRFDLTLDPAAGTQPMLRTLILDIPLKSEWAALATHHATWTDPQRSSSAGFSGSVDEWFATYPDGTIPFTYATYLGTEDRGVQWFCESDRGWSNADGERVVSIVREGGTTTLKIAMVDAPMALTSPWTVTFGLTVTPVKDTTECRRTRRVAEGRLYDKHALASAEMQAFHDAYRACDLNAITIYMTDDNHFGSPRMQNPQQEAKIRSYVDLVHERGFSITPYTGWGVNANIPAFATFGQEMLAEPVKNIGWGCFLHVHNQVLQDWWLSGARYTIEECGLDGVYGDGFSMPRLLQNELEGFAWVDTEGRPRGTYSIWRIREFIERLYTFCHVESSRPAQVRNHYNQEIYCIGAFTDERVTGEGQYHAGDTLTEIQSLAACRANFMTHLNGVHTVGLWWNYLKLPVKRNEMRTMFLLHDVPMAVGGGIVRYYGREIGYGRTARPWVHVDRVRRAFDGSVFTGYWQKPGVSFEPAGPVASTWTDAERGRALVVVGNLPNESWTGTVILDRERLGVPADAEVRDAMFDEVLPTDGDRVAIDINPQRYRLLILGDRVPIPDSPRITNDDPE